ncbi:MAG: hypothetical protein ACI4JK_12730 [Oscillospiraceae bacterium]
MVTSAINSLVNKHYIDVYRYKICKSAVLGCIFSKMEKTKWIKLKNAMYYNTEYQLIVGDPSRENFYGTTMPSVYNGFTTKLISQEVARDLFYFKKDDCPFIINNSVDSAQGKKRYITCDGGCIDISYGDFKSWSMNATDHLKIPCCPLSSDDFIEDLLIGVLEIDESIDIKKTYPLLSLAFEADFDYIDLASKLKIPQDLIDKKLKEISLSVDLVDELVEDVVSADYKRCELEPEDKKCVEDVNYGHWELWGEEEIGPALSKTLIARNPAEDVHSDGVVGIDFGTKSTIVSFMDGNDLKRLHRIGIGQLSKEPEPFHYENPTVMEFIDIDSFLEDYKSENGRPHTSIEDLTVSHKANNSLKNSESSDMFYSFFYDIKQWCGDSKRNNGVKIIDQNHNEFLLPPYLEIKEGEFDPVEIYAYYLGLFINNMRNGVFLNYILSFPVAYEKAVKEKLLKSFTRGIKKSLPDAILENEELMQDFRVVQGVSEPAAYAITALQTYGFDPADENEKIFYGIFDFGGGTTDFDFGIWRGAATSREERKYNYVIEHFGSEGDKFLGGENLLELAAFEIFKSNRKKLLKSDNSNGFSFVMPSECSPFAGSEVLISNSQEAKRNMKQLVEKIRPLWEGLTEIADTEKGNENVINEKYLYVGESDYSDGMIKLDLFDKEGMRVSGIELDIAACDIVKIFEERIEKGVCNFFEALKLTFKTHSLNDSEKIHIFLAGNSCKSPIVKHCFNKYIEKYSNEIVKRKGNSKQYFLLYPPLGTNEAKDLLIEKHIWNDELEGLYAPTGKTGVALGLLEGRKGGTIKVISEVKATDEAKFRFYIGTNSKKKFMVVLSRDDEYNKWVDIDIPADDEFELYYTTLPEATTNNMSIVSASKKRCKLTNTNEEADIFIRAIAPTQIEFCSAVPKEIESGKYVSEPKVVDLSQ